MNQSFPHEETRNALIYALPQPDGPITDQPVPSTYVPPSHARALDPEIPIVEGIRGAGKSFWWDALNSDDHRRFVTSAFPEVHISEDIIISKGYGTDKLPFNYPSQDVFSKLAGENEPRHIWRAVVASQIELPEPFPQQSNPWSAKVHWIKDHPEEFDILFYEKNADLLKQGKKRLILFDALDRLADDWKTIRPLTKALFQMALDFRGYSNIRLKIFVRPDMLEDRDILAFPDSSKLMARKLALTWRRADLYALVFQCLGNADNGGTQFRDHCAREFHQPWRFDESNSAWILSDALRRDEDIQKEVFHAIAGRTMAKGDSGHKRGFPYTWLPNHLMDGRNQVSPRSFCAALRKAAKQDPLPDWPFPLSYKAIQTGVQEASRIRVDEITREDYPWINDVMAPLRNRITVPCSEHEISSLWEAENTLQKLQSQLATSTGVKLPPQHIDEGAQGVLRDLEDLGVIQILLDRRIQMPDVYRVAFKLGRRGGVKPLR